MAKRREISVVVNYPKDKENLKEFNNRKARIVNNILESKYGDVILDKYISSMREKREEYS